MMNCACMNLPCLPVWKLILWRRSDNNYFINIVSPSEEKHISENIISYILMLIFWTKIYIIKCEKFNINKVIITASASKNFIFIWPYSVKWRFQACAYTSWIVRFNFVWWSSSILPAFYVIYNIFIMATF